MKRALLAMAVGAAMLGPAAGLADQTPAPTQPKAETVVRRKSTIKPAARLRLGPVVRFAGTGIWSLVDADLVAEFFENRFGRPLPVSAWGQTALHDRLRLDHRNAFDVAVHPDSPEGRALMAFLRDQGVPFVAVRARMRGASTGAHIHIGPESCKFAPWWRPTQVAKLKNERVALVSYRHRGAAELRTRPVVVPDDRAAAGSLSSKDRFADDAAPTPPVI